MDTYKINKKNYYLTSDLMMEYRKEFRGCKNGREYIIKKKVPKTEYVFAREYDGEYIETDGKSRKYDKIMIRKRWIDERCGEKEKEEKLEEAPDTIELEENEKFVDNEGNIIEIEVRGEREYDKCYFKVKDIMDGFGIKRLNEYIVDKRREGYVVNEHYKFFYFYIKKTVIKKKARLCLYLTYAGFMRMLNTTIKKRETTKNIIWWLHQFIGERPEKYIVKKISENKLSKDGMVYCISSPIINGVKIGFWTGTLKGLIHRYTTYYGNKMKINYVETNDPYRLEQKCMKKYAKNKICNEIFEKEHMNKYITYLEKNK